MSTIINSNDTCSSNEDTPALYDTSGSARARRQKDKLLKLRMEFCELGLFLNSFPCLHLSTDCGMHKDARCTCSMLNAILMFSSDNREKREYSYKIYAFSHALTAHNASKEHNKISRSHKQTYKYLHIREWHKHVTVSEVF